MAAGRHTTDEASGSWSVRHTKLRTMVQEHGGSSTKEETWCGGIEI